MSEVKNNNSEDSFKKRYSFKLITNIIGLGIGLITQSIVPRALGPASYGNFSFLTSFFWSVAGFLNFNSSTFFYTKLSQKQDDKTLVGFYFYFVLIIGLFLGVILAFPVVLGYNEIIWPEQKFIFVILGAIWAYMSFYVMILVDMSDAYGLTVKSEKVNTVLKIVGLTIILIMFWKNWFSLLNYFLYHLLILALSISALIYIIFKNKKSLSPFWRLDNAQVKKYAKDFSKFCAPLIVFTFLGVVAQILERWFLQTFSGSVKQGFFALSSQVASISFLFTSAVMPLVLRDQAISFGNKDLERSQKIFKRSTFTLYLLTTFFCCFIAVEAKTVLLFFGGQAYSEALVPLAIMSLYPIHQTYGQLNGNFFFATERVVAYRNIGLIFIFIGIPITFFLLGPEKYGALQYGATGLALKMVGLQIISTNVQLWFNVKYLKISFKEFLVNQIACFSICMLTALACSYAVDEILKSFHFSIRFLISGLFYSSCMLVLIIKKPNVFSLEEEDVLKVLNYVKGKLAFQR